MCYLFLLNVIYVDHRYSMFEICSKYAMHVHFISPIFSIVISHSQMVIICYLCSPYFIYGWPTCMFTIFHLWLAYMYVHHMSHMLTIGHLWLRYGHHMSHLLNVYYICIPSYHLLSKMFTICHIYS